MLDHEAPTPEVLLSAARAASDDRERERLADLVGAAARRLAPDDVPPENEEGAASWRMLVDAADRLHGSGVHALGRPAFLTDALLAMLADEARVLRPADAASGRRATAGAGNALGRVAASRQLRDVVSDALGAPAAPTLEALYEYDGPGARVRTHVDGAGWEIVCHLLIAHEAPGGDGTSELIAHLPGSDAPTALRLAPGDGVVLRGRGTLHSWAPLGPRDGRILAAIGFRAG